MIYWLAARVAPWEPYNVPDVATFPGFELHYIDSAQRLITDGRLGPSSSTTDTRS